MHPYKPPARYDTYWLALILACVPALVTVLCYPKYVGSDDAYIHLQIATNFVQGLGWGINPHQPVNLSTGPGFTLLLAAAVAMTQNGVLLTQILSVTAVFVGLGLVFLVVYSETESPHAALFAEFSAAFSVNLWRWNGSMMEAPFAFAVIASTLYLFRSNASNRPWILLLRGVVMGLGVLLRPEMGIVIILGVLVQWVRSSVNSKIRDVTMVLVGVAAPVAPWCIFAWRQFGSVVPTTFGTKSASGLVLFNGVILRQFGESVFESILFPTLLIMSLFVIVRVGNVTSGKKTKWLAYVIPVGWIVGLIGFYYLKMKNLMSAGRYTLPLLPCEAVLLGLLWAVLEGQLARWQKRVAMTFIAFQMVFSLAFNYKLVMPVLRHFDSEYGASMRGAAEELAQRTKGQPNARVLVEHDIGLLSYAGKGRFEICDGGALATPSLRRLSVRDQIAKCEPAYVVESMAPSADGLGTKFPDLLGRVWERRYRQHGIRDPIPYYYAIIYHTTVDDASGSGSPTTRAVGAEVQPVMPPGKAGDMAAR